MTQPPYAQPPPKPRPRILWFFVGAGLVLLGIVVFLAALFTALRPLFHEDAVFPASSTRALDLPAHEDRALFTDGGALTCTATDGRGTPLPLRAAGGSFTVNEWSGVARFDTGDGHVTLDCSGSQAGTRVRVGQVPDTGTLVGSLVVGILAPMVLGATGVIVLIVTTVLFLTRPARPRSG
jgi:hypothetical protein